LATARIGSPEWIKRLRSTYGLTQSELASRLGVTLVTISRWENGQARPNKIALKALTALAITNQSESSESSIAEPRAPYSAATIPRLVDFRADPDMVRLFIEGERLQFGHLFSPSFGTETALIDALPHQLIAVYCRPSAIMGHK
jgi:transcriptional regulator with XRE-family HTH domain